MKPSVNLLQYTLPSGFTIDIPDINSTLYIDVDQLSLCDDVLVDQDFIFRLLKYKGLDNNYYIFNSRFYEAFKYYLSKYSLASINNSNSVSSDGDIIDSKVVNSVLTRILKNTTTNVEAFEFTLFTVNNKDKYLTQYKLLVKFAIDGSLGDKAVMTFKKLGGTSSITISDDQPDQYNRTAIWIDTKRSTIHYWDGYRYTTPYASSIDLTIDNEVPVNPELADNGSVPSTKAVSLADQRLRNELSNLNLSVTSKLDDIDTNISNILLDLDKKVDKTSIGAINGVAGLDFTGKVPTSQLPDGIGEVISVNNKKGVVVLTKDDIGLNNVDNTSDVNKPISTLQKEALDTKVDKVPGKQLSTEDFTTALKKKLEELVPGGGVPDNILDLLNLKYDKSGGLISGDVQVNGLVEAKDDVVAYSNVRDIMLQASSGGSMYLYELLDVNITDPINGALLMYDSNSKMWINKDLTEDFTHIYNLIADKYDKTGGAITGNVQISGYLSVGERISGRLLSISEGATVNVLSVTTDASIGGNLNVSSGITCLTLDVKANAKVGLDLNVGDNVYAGKDVVAFSDKHDVLLLAEGGGATYLYELLDVDLTSVITGQYLKYDGSKWVNSGISYNILTDKPSIPNVPSWALAATKPSYNWSEINSKPSWIGASKPTYTASEVGALGANETAADSSKLGGRAAADYWHLENSNLDTVDWRAKDLNAAGNGNIKGNLLVLGEATTYSQDGVEVNSFAGASQYLNDLLDVNITNTLINQYLKYNGTEWINSGISYTELTNVPSSFTPAKHTHAISDVISLQTTLNNKVDVVSGKGLSTNDYTTAEKTKLSGIEAGAQVNTVISVSGKTGAVTLVKADVGLANVDNTSDAAKPISTATQTALNGKLGKTETAADSSKLGGRAAADFWHAGNSNIKSVSWEGSYLRAWLNRDWAASIYSSGVTNEAIFGVTTKADKNNSLAYIRVGVNKLQWSPEASAQFDIWHDGNSVGRAPSKARRLTTENLNDIQVAGFYYQDANANALATRNYPVDQQAGSLVVKMAAGLIQEYTLYGSTSNSTFVRAYSGSIWSGWKKIFNSQNANNSTEDWKGKNITAYNAFSLINGSIEGAYISYNTNNGGYVQLRSNTGVNTSIIRGYSVEGLQAEFTAGGIKIGSESVTAARIHMANKGVSKYFLIGGSTSTITPENFILWNQNSGSILFGTNDVERMRLTATGNVGIGTSSPTEKFVVVGGNAYVGGFITCANATGFRINSSKGSAKRVVVLDATDKVYIGGIDSETNDVIIRHSGINVFNMKGSAISDTLNIANGKVGIGVLTPSAYKLQVNGVLGVGDVADTSASRIACFYRSTMTNDSNLCLQLGKTNSAQNCAEIAYNHVSDSNYNNFLSIGHYGADNTNRAYFIANGRVGIGTKTPRAKLDVNGVIRTNEQFIVDSDANTAKMCIQVSNDKSFYLDQNFNLVAKSGCTSTNTWNITNPSGVHMFSINAINGQTEVRGNLIVKGEATTYSLDGVQTTSSGMTREAYVPLSQFEAMEKRLSDQIALLQTEINKLKTN